MIFIQLLVLSLACSYDRQWMTSPHIFQSAFLTKSPLFLMCTFNKTPPIFFTLPNFSVAIYTLDISFSYFFYFLPIFPFSSLTKLFPYFYFPLTTMIGMIWHQYSEECQFFKNLNQFFSCLNHFLSFFIKISFSPFYAICNNHYGYLHL